MKSEKKSSMNKNDHRDSSGKPKKYGTAENQRDSAQTDRKDRSNPKNNSDSKNVRKDEETESNSHVQKD